MSLSLSSISPNVSFCVQRYRDMSTKYLCISCSMQQCLSASVSGTVGVPGEFLSIPQIWRTVYNDGGAPQAAGRPISI